MSLCFNHIRRTLGTSSAVGKRICATSTTTLSSSSSNALANPIISSDILTRHFAAAAAAAPKKNKKGGKGKAEAALSYNERKAAAKQVRSDRWDSKMNRLERLKTRRDNSPKDVKKNLFRGWWDKEMLYHSKLTKQAKREGKPWRIRVVAMVERLLVITPDMEEWEWEYLHLRD